MARSSITLVLPLLLVAGCAAPQPVQTGGPLPPTPTPTPSPMVCNADGGQWAVGKTASDDVVERVRNDTHSQVVRVLRQGMMATMEFRADRVDLQLDTQKVILQVRCG